MNLTITLMNPIITFIIIVVIAFLYLLPVIKRKRCKNCGTNMKRELDDESQIIFLCPNCDYKEDTDIFIGGGNA